MKLANSFIGTGTAAMLLAAAAIAQPATAGTLGPAWTYAADAVGDGSGGSGYDIKGIAMSAQGDQIFVALTGGMSLAGDATYSQARGGNINWGDLFFNFSGSNFNTAQGSLFGVRFASGNDTSVATGIYSNVTTTSVAEANVGYSSLNHYYNSGYDAANTQGEALATRTAVTDYFGGDGQIQNSIGSGTKLGDIALLTAAELSAKGLNFGNVAGSQTFGFSFAQSLLPSGSFLANVFLECGNDGVAFAANQSAAAVPEPTTMAGTAIGIAALAGLKRRRQQKAAKAVG